MKSTLGDKVMADRERKKEEIQQISSVIVTV